MIKVSVIFVHYAANKDRSELARKCLIRLEETLKNYPAELIVVDNGGNLEDSQFFLKEAEEKRITNYIRNADNLWFGYARNQGIDISQGEYICITDNDIEFLDGWIEECMSVLETVGGKHFITPLKCDNQHLHAKYYREPVRVGDVEYKTNSMAGSSCWIMPRKSFKEVGHFVNRMKSGTVWNRDSAKLGYSMILLPNRKAGNCGVRGTPYQGYSKGQRNEQGDMIWRSVDIIKTLTNGKTIKLNA